MRDCIKEFPNHISDALQISESLLLDKDYISNREISNIVISGQGGSAIGGVITKDLIQHNIKTPIIINKNYDIPSFIDSKTLFIASSYSGNTEETISALNKVINLNKNGENVLVVCICSGGKMLELAKKNKLKYIVIPEGGAPRAMLCYSVVQMLMLISIFLEFKQSHVFRDQLNNVKNYLIKNQQSIIELAKSIAKQIDDKMPFIYTFSEFEGVALRFKQQLNENSKRHATYNLIPEMNHNEIVAWNKKNMCVAPIFINGNTSEKNKKRMSINIKQIEQSVDNTIELTCDNNSSFIQYFYFIHLVDWISLIMAENQGVDPNEINAINYLKKELKNT